VSTESQNPRVLVLSQKNIRRDLSHCPHSEFVDVICQIDSVELLCSARESVHRTVWFAKRLAYHLPVTLNLGVEQFRRGTHAERQHNADKRVRLTSIVGCN